MAEKVAAEVSKVVAEAMAATLATATLTMVENAGHRPMQGQPQATTTGIRNWLSEVAE
jgi:pimeloyl-ACP methyl ester carboxylesterase